MKKSTIGIIILLMIIAIAIFVFTGNKQEKNTNETNATPVNEEENVLQNEQTNEIISNEIENQIENQMANEIVVENEVSSEIFEESPKTEKEKALDIVKKDWGEGANIEFSVDGIDGNGSYIVTVRNSQTTEALAFYTVNTNNGTFTKREMN